MQATPRHKASRRILLHLMLLLELLILFSLPNFSPAATIHIAGDSTASHYSADTYPRTGWGQVLAGFYDAQHTIRNLAQSGRSAKSYIEQGFLTELEHGVKEGDLVLIQFGHNDAKQHSPERYTAPDGEFQAFLMRYVTMARARKATPVLLTPVARRKFTDGKLMHTHGPYPQAIRELAMTENVAMIDLNRLSRQWVRVLGETHSKRAYLHPINGTPHGYALAGDDSHFSRYGAQRIAAFIAQELNDQGLLSLRLPTPNILRVEKDGSGDATEIQAALNLLDDDADLAIVLVGEGVFEGPLKITRDNVAIVGQGRDKTTIKASVLRAEWRQDNPDDWGAATINIKASDISFLGLRIVNDYGLIRGNHSHQFALRLLSGSRILSEDTSFISGGADTVSLWNKTNGLYYHRRAYFEGYTDFVCPRGWSYITHSTFFSRGGAAAIWHDGELDEDQKLVITHSSFDGVSDFVLGRRHYDAQFYLIHNRYSRNLANQPIFRVTYDDANKNRKNKWGDRAYFFGSVKEGIPYPWLADNISHKEAHLTVVDIFKGRWNPEAKLAQIGAQVALHEVSRINLLDSGSR